MFRGEHYFLSNFYVHPFYSTFLGREVQSSEHAFMAMKTIDRSEQEYVLSAETPKQAKFRGRSVTLRPEWNEGARVYMMADVLRDKFNDPVLRQKLVNTGTIPLVENNDWHDQFWGNCTCLAHADIPGTNMLGELLMARRYMLASYYPIDSPEEA